MPYWCHHAEKPLLEPPWPAFDRVLPWTRRVRPGLVTVPGGTADLAEYSREHREDAPDAEEPDEPSRSGVAGGGDSGDGGRPRPHVVDGNGGNGRRVKEAG